MTRALLDGRRGSGRWQARSHTLLGCSACCLALALLTTSVSCTFATSSSSSGLGSTHIAKLPYHNGSPRTMCGASSRLPRVSSVLQRRAWQDLAFGPLGFAEPAGALYIYYFPYVPPLDVDLGVFLQLIFFEFITIFALTSAFVFLFKAEIDKLSKSSREDMTAAAAKEARGGFDATMQRLSSLPASQWFKLLLCLALDLIGTASYAVGPSAHFVLAPLTAVVLRTLFGGSLLAVLGFLEEAFSITDLLPTATLAWLLQSLLPSNGVTRFLGIQPLQQSSDRTPEFTLLYFNLRARGEVLRMIFRHGGISYKDETLTVEKWPDIKPTMPGGSVPAIRFPDGRLLGESVEIAKYAVSLAPGKLAPEDPSRQGDALAVWEDDQSTSRPWCQPPDIKSLDNCNPLLNFFPVKDAEERLGKGMSNLTKLASIWFKHLDTQLEGGPFLFGASRPCHADFMVFARIDSMMDLYGEILQKEGSYAVRSFYKSMMALPSVAGYLSERPAPGSPAWGSPGSIFSTYTNTAKRS